MVRASRTINRSRLGPPGGRPLEFELFAVLGGDAKARIVARYYGLDGLGGTTLQGAGCEFGISAERVRQIVSGAVKQLSSSQPFTPVLDRTISFLAQHIPARADEMERKLLSEGLSGVPFRLEGLIRAAELLGRTRPFWVTTTKRLRLVHRQPVHVIETIVRTGRRTIEHRGIATIGDVSARIREADREGGLQFVGDVLSGEEDFHWLDPTELWFWLSSVVRNPVVTRIRKILSVANPVRIAALQAGIARDYRMRGCLAPARVLLELCRQITGLQVDADVVRAAPPISRDRVLGSLEKRVLDLLARNGGLMRRASLASACLAKGINRSSFYGLLEHSPVITSYAPGVFGPVGAETPPSALERLDRSLPLDRHPRNCDSTVGHRTLRGRKYRSGP
jgi:Sigma-70, region 4